MASINWIRRTDEEKVDPSEEIKQCIVDFDECDKQLRIAFVGSPGHGKSSIQNTVSAYTCNPPRVKQVARAGHGEGNMTKGFAEHPLEVWSRDGGKNAESGIIMVDTPGRLCNDLRLEYEKLEHNTRQEEYIEAMILEDVIWPLQRAGATCLVAVVSAHQVWKEAKQRMTKFQLLRGGLLQIPQESPTHRRLQILRKILNAGGNRQMRPICIVTYVDRADKSVGRDICKVANSSLINRVTAYIARQLGLNRNLVHPMVNLCDEFDPSTNMELGRTALRTFRHVLQAAEDGYRDRAVNPPQPPPPPLDASQIKASGTTELRMVTCRAPGNVM